MRFLALFALCLPFFAAAEGLTWKEANKRSAEALRAGDERAGIEFARQSFELYATQSQRYSPDTHAQLLMNLVDAIDEKDGATAALEQLDSGAAALVQRYGSTPPILASIWDQALRKSLLSGRPKPHTNRYYEATIAATSSLWGPDDPRSIAVRARWAPLMHRINGKKWVREQLSHAREQSIATANETLELAFDVALARLELEDDDRTASIAIPVYEAAIARLTARKDEASRATLRNALNQLAYAYRAVGDKEGQARTAARDVALRGPPVQDLVPIKRVNPNYPYKALQAGQPGYVVFELTVSAEGSVIDATLLDSFPRGWFEKSALDALMNWRFAPRSKAWQGEQRIDFSLGPR